MGNINLCPAYPLTFPAASRPGPSLSLWERLKVYAPSACHMAMMIEKARMSPTVPEPILFIA